MYAKNILVFLEEEHKKIKSMPSSVYTINHVSVMFDWQESCFKHT